jgi:hypothetical protein
VTAAEIGPSRPTSDRHPNSERRLDVVIQQEEHRVRPAQALDWPLGACFAGVPLSADIDPGQQLIIVIGKGTLIT